MRREWQCGTLEDGNRLLFVGGPARSGTTLVQNTLDSHPEILGTPELLHLPTLLQLRSSFRRSVDEGMLDYFCNASDVDQAVYEFADRLLGPVVAATDARYVSEKSPSNVLVFEGLHALLPAARFVFVVRDPRAIVSSLLKVGERARVKGEGVPEYTQDVRKAIRSVRDHLKAGFDFARRCPDRCCVLRYEHLTACPEEVTRELCDFLGLEWSAAMLRAHELPHAGEQAITRGGVWYDAESFNRRPDPARIDGWSTELAPKWQVLVTRAFGDDAELQAIGYRLGLDHLRGPRRMLGQFSWAREAAVHRLRRSLGPA